MLVDYIAGSDTKEPTTAAVRNISADYNIDTTGLQNYV
jgi:hypothetical protein